MNVALWCGMFISLPVRLWMFVLNRYAQLSVDVTSMKLQVLQSVQQVGHAFLGRIAVHGRR